MLPSDGVVVAGPDVRVDAWIRALSPDTSPMALAPQSGRGWFGGLEVIAWGPRELSTALPMTAAAGALQTCLSSSGPCLGVALLPYDDGAVAATYDGGLVRTPGGWRVWGSLRPSDVPTLPPERETVSPGAPLVACSHTDMSRGEFCDRVRAIAEAIRGGDVYVLNLTRRIVGRPVMPPEDAFTSLLDRCGADMGAFWATPEVTVASASPERFVRISGQVVQICPIKGTRPRAEGLADRAMIEDLLSSEKERAEHVMIVDLVRNDLGRVCRPGSIVVDPLFGVITTPYCHQMVSTVRGVLEQQAALASVFDSAFPCGSVTGAPKIAAMRKIEKLEATPRGAYTGSLVAAIPGELDSSILIRTAEYSEGEVRWGTGGGITVDSVAEDEWLETELKASPFVGRQHRGC